MRKVYQVHDNKIEQPKKKIKIQPGDIIHAAIHPEHAPGTLLGTVKHINKHICIYVTPSGITGSIMLDTHEQYTFTAPVKITTPTKSIFLRIKNRGTTHGNNRT